MPENMLSEICYQFGLYTIIFLTPAFDFTFVNAVNIFLGHRPHFMASPVEVVYLYNACCTNKKLPFDRESNFWRNLKAFYPVHASSALPLNFRSLLVFVET